MEPEDRYRYGVALTDVNEYELAEQQLDQIQDWPEHAFELDRLRGCICFHQERFDETIELETRALERFADDVEALTVRASARYFTGDLVGVEQDIRAAMRLDDAHEMINSIVVNLVRLGKARDAITFWHDTHRAKPATKLNAVGVANLRTAIPQLSSRAERLALEHLVA
jgi:tetratricopeptide (TPR) repeat protein